MHYNVCVLALTQAHVGHQYSFLSLLYISGALISFPMMGGDAGTKCNLFFCCRAGIRLLGSQRGQLPCERHVSMSAANPPSTMFTTFPQGTGHCAAWLSFQMLTSLTSVGVHDRSTSPSTHLGSMVLLCCWACRRLDSSRDSICSWHALKQSWKHAIYVE